MAERAASPWSIREVDPSVVQRLAAAIGPHPRAVEMGVDIVGDPHREDDEGYNWTRLRYARSVADVTPGSVVVMGSRVGTYLAKVIAWDFEVSDDDPIVTLDILPVTPEAVEARARAKPHLRRVSRADRETLRADTVGAIGRALRNLAVDSPADLADALADAFPSIEFLPVDDRRLFLDEFFRLVLASAACDDYDALTQLVREWRSTAEVHGDPKLARRLGKAVKATVDPVAVPGA